MDDEDYEEKPVKEVGYRKPPEAHQFKKGRSGNPKGRPPRKKKVDLPPGLTPLTANVILAEARRLVAVRDGTKVQHLDTLQALVRALNITGLKGNRRAQVDAIKLARQAEEAAEKAWSGIVDSVVEYKLSWREGFEYYDAKHLPRPDVVPHPDEIVLDHVNRRVVYNGPETASLKADWDRIKKRRDDSAAQAAYMRKRCRDKGSAPGSFARLIVIEDASVKYHDGIFPDEPTRRAPGFNIHDWRRRNGVLAQLERDGWRSFLPPEFREPLDPEGQIQG